MGGDWPMAEMAPEVPRIPLTWRQTLAGFAAVLLLWASAVLHGFGSEPLALPWLEVPAAAAFTCSFALMVHGSYRGWAGGWLARFGLPAVAVSAVVLLVGSRFFWLTGQGFSEMFAVLLSVPLMLGLLITALVRMFRHPAESFIVVLTIAVFSLVLVLGVPQPFPSLRTRIEVVGMAKYEREARQELAHPTMRARIPDGEPFVAQNRLGRQVVGWALVQAIPFKTYGLVYDPGNRLRSGSGFKTRSSSVTYEVSRWNCDRVSGPWFWCRFY